ncbi:hypothetical protein L208DRAFT_1004554, partial [Tricholoma matsutake]
IWQQNLCKSQITQQCVLNTAQPKNWDILGLQEPFLDSLGNTKASLYWRVLYPSNHHKDNSDCSCSVLLINTNINTNSYTPLDIHCNNITAVHFSGEFGSISIFNIYNDCTYNNVLLLLHSFLTTSFPLARPTPHDQMLWISNFNRHHSLWELETNRRLNSTRQTIDPLLDLLHDFDMVLTLPLGIPTLEMATGNWTRPDNV